MIRFSLCANLFFQQLVKKKINNPKHSLFAFISYAYIISESPFSVKCNKSDLSFVVLFWIVSFSRTSSRSNSPLSVCICYFVYVIVINLMFYLICLWDCWSYKLFGWLFDSKEVDKHAYNVTINAFKHNVILPFEYGSDGFKETKKHLIRNDRDWEKKNKTTADRPLSQIGSIFVPNKSNLFHIHYSEQKKNRFISTHKKLVIGHHINIICYLHIE